MSAWLAVPGFGVGLAIGLLLGRRRRRRHWSLTLHMGAKDDQDTAD